MIRQGASLKCPNCGHEFTVSPTSTMNTEVRKPRYACPVCQYSITDPTSVDLAPAPNIADIQTQLDQLLRSARASGVQPAEIVELLRAELQFEAELAQAGRRVVVQVIDLGPQELTPTTAGVDPYDIPNPRHTGL